MAESVGGIYYDIEARTDGLIQGRRAVKSSATAIGADMQRIGASAERMNTQVSTSAKGVTNALAGVGRSAGQAGIQIQQFVGQIQGGVSPMVALSQQGADLGFMLGAPLLGAIVGISASIAGMLIPSLFDSTNATEALEKAMINLDKVVTKTDDGVLVLSEEIRELAKVSEAAARARIATAMLDVQDALKQAGAAAVDTFDALDAGFGLSSIGDYTNRVRYAHDNTEGFLKTSMELGKELGYTGQQAQQAGRDMLVTLSQVANAPTPEAFNRLQEQIAAAVNDGKASDGIKRLYNDLAGIIAQANSAAEAQEMLNKALANFPEFLAQSQSAAAGFKTQMDGLLSSIKAQADTAGMTAKQVAIYTAEQLAAKDSTIDLNKALAEIDQYFERIEAQELLTQRTREQQQAITQAKTAWDNYAKSIETQSAKAESAEASNALMIQRIRETGAAAGKSAAEIQSLVDAQQRLFEQQQQQEADKAKQKVGSDVRFAGVTDQQAELTRLADSYMQQQLLLQTALEMELITRQEYADRKLLLEQQTQEQINQINQQGTASLKEQLDSVGFNLDTFQNQAIGAFAAVATGAMSGKDAIRGLAQSILTTAIGALIKMAVTAAIGQKAATATGAATAAALGAAYATPAALASLASFGANAAPASAGIASTVALSQGLALGGGRLNGGPVRPGMIYPVTEDGRPELLMSGGKQYLLPGSRGEVVSNKDMGRAGGSNVTVNVINNASGTKVEEKRSQGPDGAQMIEIIVADIQQRGKVHNAITNTTTAGNRI